MRRKMYRIFFRMIYTIDICNLHTNGQIQESYIIPIICLILKNVNHYKISSYYIKFGYILVKIIL
jgi:hypothetical protein